MACGAMQTPPDLSGKFSGLDMNRLISSDAFLRPDLFNKKCTELKNIVERPKKIVIVGGSHSGFSCAWMLINGPASHVNNALKVELKRAHLVPKKHIKSCSECCNCFKNSKKQGAVLGVI
jgi:hypothetical protein